MGFVCTLTPEEKIEGFTEGSSSLAIVPIGYDDDEHISYKLVVGIDQVPGDMEFWFHIVSVNHDDMSETVYWTGKEVATIIPRLDRAKILVVLLAAAEAVLEEAEPPSFFMCTIEEDLPPRGLEKHERVCEVFRANGYSVTERASHHGKRLWVMERTL